MTSVASLEDKYKKSKETVEQAWAAFAYHRSLLWAYHVYQVILKSYQSTANQGKLPTQEFLTKFSGIRKNLSDISVRLPEYEKYKDCVAFRKECYQELLYAKVTEAKKKPNTQKGDK